MLVEHKILVGPTNVEEFLKDISEDSLIAITEDRNLYTVFYKK